MAAKYWIKLYHEVLHDRKMGTLDDRLWRRVIECILLAGETDEEGFLPSLEDMAWTLRANIEQLETELDELVQIGILEFIDARYYMRKFAERQATMSKAEYMRRLRKEKQADDHYQPETTGLPPGYQPLTDSHTDKKRIDKKRTKQKEETTAAVSSFQDINSYKAQQIYTRITDQVSIPSSNVDTVIEDLCNILDKYEGDDQAVSDGKKLFVKWCSTRGRSGKTYSKTNPGWLSWWLEEQAPTPGEYKQEQLPRPNVLCGDGQRLLFMVESHTPGQRNYLPDYKAHVDSCFICGGATNAPQVKSELAKLAERMKT